MPEDEGYILKGLGLGDWQTIRARMKKERAIDAASISRELHNQQQIQSDENEPKSVEEVEALMDQLWAEEMERIRQAGLDKTNPNPQVRQMLASAIDAQQQKPQSGKTNPFPAAVAAA